MRRIISACILLLANVSVAFTQAPQEPVRYTLILAGNKAGFETVTAANDGRLQVHFEFNDRGRGPSIDETIALAPSGVPNSIESKGVDYLKAPVSETFTLANGKAAWKNRAEQGEKQITGDAFYSSVSGTPEESRLMLNAAMRAPGQKLALLPEGAISVEKKTEMKLDAGGRQRTFVLYWISGVGFTPNPVWLTDDGKYMVNVSPWFSQIPEGWDSVIDPLLKTQNSFSEKRAGELAKALGRRPPRPLVIVHANLFDSATATSQPGSTVIITGNKITAVGRDGQVTIPTPSEVIDAKGKSLLPGLWDMHVHLSPDDGLLHMANGVTSVRDLANDTESLMKLRDQFDQGAVIGPRVLMAGFIDGRGPYQGPTKVFADNEEEARKDVENYARLGYVQIKVYSSLKPELVPKIAVMAHEHGMRLSGHVPAGMVAGDFIRAGADEVQHMNFILLNFMPQVKETRTPARFTEVAAHAAELDLNSEQVKSFIHLLQERHTVVDPTLSIFEEMFTNRPGQMPPGWAGVADRMPSEVRRGYLYGGLEVPKNGAANGNAANHDGKDGAPREAAIDWDRRYRDSFGTMLRMTKLLYDSGVPIVAGTDSLPGFSLHRELELYVDAGIPAPKVLQLATLGAARIMKRDSERGSIATGKLADLILVDGNPSLRIKDIDRVQTVIKDGVMYNVADLDKAIGVRPE